MICRMPPTSRAMFEEANRTWPGRSTAGDGTCPSSAHHQANPTSDHEPDRNVNYYSCAFDLTHDPAHHLDAHGPVAERLRTRARTGLEPRIKYLIRHNFQTSRDELAEPPDWTWADARQNHHASHLHVSLVHDLRVLHDATVWFESTYTIPHEEPDMAQPVMVFPEKTLRVGSRPTVLTIRGDHRGTKLTREEADAQNKAGVQRIQLPMVLWDQMVIR